MKLNIYSQNSGTGGTVFVIVLSFHNVQQKLQIKIQIKLNIYSQNSGAGGTVFVIVLSFHNVEKKTTN